MAEHAAAREPSRHLATGGCRHPRRRRDAGRVRPPSRGDARRAAAARAGAVPRHRPADRDGRGRRRHRPQRLLRAAARPRAVRARPPGVAARTGGTTPPDAHPSGGAHAHVAGRARRRRPRARRRAPRNARPSSWRSWRMPESPAPRRASGTASPAPPRPARCAIWHARTSVSRRRACTPSRSASSTGSSRDLGGDPGGTTAGLGTIIHAALEHAAGHDEAGSLGGGRVPVGRADVRGRVARSRRADAGAGSRAAPASLSAPLRRRRRHPDRRRAALRGGDPARRRSARDAPRENGAPPPPRSTA